DSHVSEVLPGRALHEFLRHHFLAYVIGNSSRRAQNGVWQYDSELFAAVTSGGILAFDVILHRHCNETQDLVTRQMAEAVGERLEMFTVAQHQSQRLVAAA